MMAIALPEGLKSLRQRCDGLQGDAPLTRVIDWGKVFGSHTLIISNNPFRAISFFLYLKICHCQLNKAITECPDSPAFSHLLSEMYRILGLSQAGQGKMDEAVSSLRKAVELNDQSTWAHIHYGKILYLSDPNLAPQTDREFDIALEQDSRIEIWRNLIEFWRWVGDSERAHRLCERANGIGLSGELTKECPAP
jgi:tetratricopeptide (TPR) repeat protein